MVPWLLPPSFLPAVGIDEQCVEFSGVGELYIHGIAMAELYLIGLCISCAIWLIAGATCNIDSDVRVDEVLPLGWFSTEAYSNSPAICTLLRESCV